jgi:serine protease
MPHPTQLVAAALRHLAHAGVVCALLAGLSTAAANPAPWHLAGQQAQANPAPAAINAWGIAPGPHRVVVAVVDSGVLPNHPALQGRLLPGYDMQSAPHSPRGGRSPNATPEAANQSCRGQPVTNAYRTHGTEVASLIAGNGHDGVWGVNPQALVVPVRIMGPCPMTRQDIHDAIAWAAGLPVQGVPTNPHPAQIINLSFAGGGFNCDARTQALVDQVVAKGVFVVAAGGNNFCKPLQEPANCRGVISVGALNALNELEGYSALDKRTTIYAPGGGRSLQLQAPWAVNKLRVATEELDLLGRARLTAADRGIGTSFAAPVVAGFLALMLSYQPQARPQDLQNNLQAFARRLQIDGAPGCPCEGLGLFLERQDSIKK